MRAHVQLRAPKCFTERSTCGHTRCKTRNSKIVVGAKPKEQICSSQAKPTPPHGARRSDDNWKDLERRQAVAPGRTRHTRYLGADEHMCSLANLRTFDIARPRAKRLNPLPSCSKATCPIDSFPAIRIIKALVRLIWVVGFTAHQGERRASGRNCML